MIQGKLFTRGSITLREHIRTEFQKDKVDLYNTERGQSWLTIKSLSLGPSGEENAAQLTSRRYNVIAWTQATWDG